MISLKDLLIDQKEYNFHVPIIKQLTSEKDEAVGKLRSAKAAAKADGINTVELEKVLRLAKHDKNKNISDAQHFAAYVAEEKTD